ncbi:MAG: ABC transporter substrate-binding protein, partial [Fidelibacterota bacterium]
IFVPPTYISRLSRKATIQLQSVPALNIRYIGFNCQKPPFNDVRVRKAANYAVNKEEIVKFLMKGRGTVASGPVPPIIPGSNHDLRRYDYNPARARKLLAEAGYSNGFRAVMWAWESSTYLPIANAVVAQLEKVGIKIKLEIFDWATFLAKSDEYLSVTGESNPKGEGVYDLYILGWSGSEIAYDYLNPLFRTGSYTNNSFYSNSTVDSLLDLVAVTFDSEKQEEILHKIQEIVVEDAPWIFLMHDIRTQALQKRVKNYRISPNFALRLTDVYLSGK